MDHDDTQSELDGNCQLSLTQNLDELGLPSICDGKSKNKNKFVYFRGGDVLGMLDVVFQILILSQFYTNRTGQGCFS